MKSALRLGESSAVLAFTVHEPPNPPADRVKRAEQLVFVRDGVSLAALLFGPLWLLFNRMWAALLAYLLIAIALGTALELLQVPSVWASLTGFALNLILALEADSIRRWTLARRGWRFIGSVVGRNTAECERRFFETWLPAQPTEREGPPAAGFLSPAAMPYSGSVPAVPAVPGPAAGFIPPQPAASSGTSRRRWRLFGGQS